MDEHRPSQVLGLGPFHPLGPSGGRFFLWGTGGAVQCGWPHDRMPLVGIIALFWAMCSMAPVISAELSRLGARALVGGQESGPRSSPLAGGSLGHQILGHGFNSAPPPPPPRNETRLPACGRRPNRVAEGMRARPRPSLPPTASRRQDAGPGPGSPGGGRRRARRGGDEPPAPALSSPAREPARGGPEGALPTGGTHIPAVPPHSPSRWGHLCGQY